jgi:hypothetical protein
LPPLPLLRLIDDWPAIDAQKGIRESISPDELLEFHVNCSSVNLTFSVRSSSSPPAHRRRVYTELVHEAMNPCGTKAMAGGGKF